MSLPFKRSYYYCIFILQPGEGAYSWVCSQRSWAMSLHLCHPVQTFPRRGSLFTIIYFDQENPKIQKVTKLLAMPLQLCHSVHASPKIGQSVAHSYLYSKHSENTHLKSLSLSFQFALAVDFNSSVYVWTHLPCQHGWMDSHFGPWVIQPWDFPPPPPCQICDETFEKQCSITFKQQVDTIEQKRYNCANVKSKNTI